jgi:hypothetical protein
MRTSVPGKFKVEIGLNFLVSVDRKAANKDIPVHSGRRNHQAPQLLGSPLSWEMEMLMALWTAELVFQ